RADVRVVDDLVAAHACNDGAVDHDGADQIAEIGGFATRRFHADAVGRHLLDQLRGASNQVRDDLAGHQLFVAADGGAQDDVFGGAHAEQVVEIHHQSVLRDALPNSGVARFFPVGVRQGGLRSCSIGVHYQAVFVAAGQK